MKERITGMTQVMALLGDPVCHSKSPEMHNYGNQLTGYDGVYVAFPVKKEELKEAMGGIRALGIRGVNVTMPFKKEVVPYLDRLSPTAELCGVVNTIVNENGVLTGYNTDGYGMMEGIHQQGRNISGETMTLFGVGGAGKAILVEALSRGAGKIHLVGRQALPTLELGELVVELLQKYPESKLLYGCFEDQTYLRTAVSSSSLLVNATPLGMDPDVNTTPLVDSQLLHSHHFLADAVYSPLETRFLADGKRVGAQTMDGLSMLLWQGAKGYELFTGRTMPVEQVREHLSKGS